MNNGKTNKSADFKIDDRKIQRNPLNCSVCQERFDDKDRRPLLLPCYHHFCLECINHVMIRGGIKVCPLCRASFEAVSSIELKLNYGVLELVNYISRFGSDSSLNQTDEEESNSPRISTVSEEDPLYDLDDMKSYLYKSCEAQGHLISKLKTDMSSLKTRLLNQNDLIAGKLIVQLNEIIERNTKYHQSISDKYEQLSNYELELSKKKSEILDEAQKQSGEDSQEILSTEENTTNGPVADEISEAPSDEVNRNIEEWIKKLNDTLMKDKEDFEETKKEVKLMESKRRNFRRMFSEIHQPDFNEETNPELKVTPPDAEISFSCNSESSKNDAPEISNIPRKLSIPRGNSDSCLHDKGKEGDKEEEMKPINFSFTRTKLASSSSDEDPKGSPVIYGKPRKCSAHSNSTRRNRISFCREEDQKAILAGLETEKQRTLLNSCVKRKLSNCSSDEEVRSQLSVSSEREEERRMLSAYAENEQKRRLYSRKQKPSLCICDGDLTPYTGSEDDIASQIGALDITDSDFPQTVDVSALSDMDSRMRLLVEQGSVFVVHKHRDRLTFGRLSLHENILSMHCFKDAVPNSGSIFIQYQDILTLVEPTSRSTFLDLSIIGQYALGRLYIYHEPFSRGAKNFALLCTGEQGHSYMNTIFLELNGAGTDREAVRGGDYKYNAGYGGKTLIKDLDLRGEEYLRPWTAGIVRGYRHDLFSQFYINTKSYPDTVCHGAIGRVIHGLNVLTYAIARYPITQITIRDCGIVLPYTYNGYRHFI